MLTEAQYRESLQALELSSLQGEILSALQGAGEKGQSAGELSRLLHTASHAQINSAFGRLGRKIAEHQGELPSQRTDGSYRWWRILADDFQEDRRGFVWVLHAPLIEALTVLSWQGHERRFSAEEDNSSKATLLREGKATLVLVNAYERNAAARRRCIEVWGSSCIVCGFNFESVYGTLGKGYIHVHHLVPLGSIKVEYEVDPATDLRPVCPNCHAMLHRTTPPLSIEAIKESIRFGQRAQPSVPPDVHASAASPLRRGRG